jgi:hypothetical protein
MAKGVVMPARSSASQNSGRTPSSRKVVVNVLLSIGRARQPIAIVSTNLCGLPTGV